MTSEIVEFYKGRSVLITGGTGYLGQCLMLKFLRACPDIKHIYLLMRSKRDKDAAKRLNEILASQMFQLQAWDHTDIASKVTAVEGDVDEEDLGLNPADRELLKKQVNVVFHMAASLSFVNNLKTSVKSNVRGTLQVVQLCNEMEHIQAFVHVSTAYSFCFRSSIDEVIYPAKFDPLKMIQFAELFDEETIDFITPRIIQGYPNTYAFSKGLAENIVKYHSVCPTAIVRPSIVQSTWKEPVAGWMSNIHGVAFFILGLILGLVGSLHLNSDHYIDIIPGDTVVNMLIAAGWKTAEEKRSRSVQVYNATCGENKLPIGEMVAQCVKCSKKYPSANAVINAIVITSSKSYYYMSVWLFQFIPALLIDAVLLISGSKSQLFRMKRKFYLGVERYQYFIDKEWKFSRENVTSLQNAMSQRDREVFDFDFSTLNWQEYILTQGLGIRRYVLKEDDKTLPEAKRLQSRYRLIKYFMMGIIGMPFGLLAFKILKMGMRQH